MHGLPRSLHLDNGAEFHSRALKRGCQQHGVRINYRPPATPRFGGHIERLMGTLMTRVHSLPGTTSSNVIARSDYQSERKAVLTLAEFERILVLEILGPYHNEVHSALGRTPAAAWADAVASLGQMPQPADPTNFVLDFLPFKDRVVRREGIRLFNVTYFDGALTSLLDRADRRCRVKYDPRSMDAVFVELPEGGGSPDRGRDGRGRRNRGAAPLARGGAGDEQGCAAGLGAAAGNRAAGRGFGHHRGICTARSR
jgi:putative transposase